MRLAHRSATAFGILLVAVVLAVAGAAMARPAAGAPSTTVSVYLPELFKSFTAGSEVVIRDFAYVPRDLTVRAGTRVVWTNEESSGVVHTVTSGVPFSPSGVFDSGTLSPEQAYGFTFATPGTYAYYCRIHLAAMTGTVTVTP